MHFFYDLDYRTVVIACHEWNGLTPHVILKVVLSDRGLRGIESKEEYFYNLNEETTLHSILLPIPPPLGRTTLRITGTTSLMPGEKMSNARKSTGTIISDMKITGFFHLLLDVHIHTYTRVLHFVVSDDRVNSAHTTYRIL